MMNIYLFEPAHYSNFFPLTYCRPVYDLRQGIFTYREKYRFLLNENLTGVFCRDYLSDVMKEENPELDINPAGAEDIIVINPLFPFNQEFLHIAPQTVLHSGNEIVAFRIDTLSAQLRDAMINATIGLSEFNSFSKKEIHSECVYYHWDIIYSAKSGIEEDFRLIASRTTPEINATVYDNVTLINKTNIRLGAGSVIKPGVVIDAEQGPVYIDSDVEIMPNAVITGPVYIGKKTKIKAGAKIYPGTAIGEYCKIGGEVEDSIIHSYVNKQHEGFLGHSYLSPWVNLGADTNNSDLKNNYAPVMVKLNGKTINTGKMFLGMIMGDHSKTAINTMINTGTIAGVFCNVFGSGFPQKFIPSFSWGILNETEKYAIDKALVTAAAVMGRRNKILTNAYTDLYRFVEKISATEWE